MKKKKNENNETVYVFQAWKVKLTMRALVILLSFIVLGTILCINVGYDKQHGCYWKPLNIKVDIKKNTVRP